MSELKIPHLISKNKIEIPEFHLQFQSNCKLILINFDWFSESESDLVKSLEESIAKNKFQYVQNSSKKKNFI